MAEQKVLTPGGYRPRSLVHQLKPHDQVVSEKGRLRKLDVRSKTYSDLPENLVSPTSLPPLGSGWIAYADWGNGTGKIITSLSTTWVVPPPPATRSGQTIFLFNGAQNFGANFGVIQPVLQWGSSDFGGGDFWAVSCWYVTNDGTALHTPLVPVQEGDRLTGLVTLTAQSPAGFDYRCEFSGIPATVLSVSGIAELLWCVLALEAYEVIQCSDYPNIQKVTMGDVGVQTDSGPPPVIWTPNDRITDCGQRAVVVDNSPTSGATDIYFRP